MDFARSSFYHAATETPAQASDQQMSVRIEAIFKAHRRRVGHELRDQGLVCAPGRVRRLMKQRGLKAIQPKNFVPKTSDGKASQPSPNLLKDQPLPKQSNRVWAGDITFIPTQSGWLYLAVVIDLCSRRILGWSLASHLRTELVLAALNQTLASRTGIDWTIFHSDRGSQYGSIAFRRVLTGAGLRQSSPPAPIPMTTPGPNPSSERSNRKCFRGAALRPHKMPKPNSSNTSKPTTIISANTPLWDTKPQINSNTNYQPSTNNDTGPKIRCISLPAI